MKTTKLMVAALSLGLVFGAAKVGLKNAEVSNDGLNLTIESNQDVHGIQFDLKYDPSNLTFNGAESLLDDFTFEYKEREAGDVRGLMFSMQGKKINVDDVTSAIKFNFEGKGTVDFENIIVAGTNGQKIEDVTFASFDIDTTPQATELKSSFPNPFNPSTTVNYTLSDEGAVNIVVYDAIGRQVAELVNGIQSPGVYSVNWDASNHASGAYFLRMATGSYTSSQKLMLVK